MTRRHRRPRHRTPSGPDPDGHRHGGRRLSRRVQVRIALSSALTNLIGAVIVFAFAVWVLPSDPIPQEDQVVLANAVGVAIWLPVAVAVGTIWSARTMGPARRWLLEERAPTPEEEVAVLRSPLRVFRVQLTLWFASAVLFSIVNGFISARLISRVGFTVVLGGLSTSAVAYLTTERLMRPVAARALAEGAVERPRLPGVAARQLLAWALGSGVPVLGLVITGILGLAEGTASRVSLSVTMICLGAVVLTVGLWVTVLGARSVSDPVRSVREGLSRVQDGDLEVEIPVYDGSDMGLLQDGFNRMVEGLREQERIRDLFGRHVGAGVARDALDRDMPLGGEVRDVAVLFVDIVGSTRLAVERPPAEVVDVLNRFFSVVVAAVDDHGGWINKFQGDAALAIFGAPDARADPAGSALAAARNLARRLEAEVPDCQAGIGVDAGPAVAGNIGAEERFEYTVIGDPVNAAARLSERAKAVPGRVLASGEAVAAADRREAARWGPGQVVTLRGRDAPTVLHHPAGASAAPRGARAVVDRSDRG
ncbi:adenylate/guanylate cyclase domain-containing protein [Iamia sp.]|uniref:adenylate/guanylate cyclase domain-containing protein n=1 Tax=Iamia sp. TaxID=2722710 RepID=UPI002B8CF430|nr:adenylate/guanylate cyclase domain-containing protein [Iamia sp.]HXH59174.1 adenylate/guanylate cyclase domain-containing protein [Iamia sp.]